MPTHVNTHVHMGPHPHMHKKEEKTMKRLQVRTDNYDLSSDIHTHTVACVSTHRCSQEHTNTLIA